MSVPMRSRPLATRRRPLPLLRGAIALLALACAPLAQAARPAQRMNDTGMTQCVDLATGTLTSVCQGTGQDGEYGRDTWRDPDRNGHAGFRFEKICQNGDPAGTGLCGKLHKWGSGTEPDDWGCNRDQVTGLTWEIKLEYGDPPRRRDALYTNWGDGSGGDVSVYVAYLNAIGACGRRNWRLPTRHELFGLLDFSTAYWNSLDTRFFPFNVFEPSSLWVAPDGLPEHGWIVDTSYRGGIHIDYRGNPHPVMLVSGP
jgi:Protein of unknown function (DUF1566)